MICQWSFLLVGLIATTRHLLSSRLSPLDTTSGSSGITEASRTSGPSSRERSGLRGSRRNQSTHLVETHLFCAKMGYKKPIQYGKLHPKRHFRPNFLVPKIFPPLGWAWVPQQYEDLQWSDQEYLNPGSNSTCCFFAPWKINGWNLQPSPSEPNLQGIMFHVNLQGCKSQASFGCFIVGDCSRPPGSGKEMLKNRWCPARPKPAPALVGTCSWPRIH